MNRKLYLALATALGSAQVLAAGSIVFDNTLPNQPHGTTTTVPLVGGHYTINASNTGYLSGTNLFESFATFIVATGEEADFTNPANFSIGNVISRVTGVGSPGGLQPTTIDGSVVSTINGANFWFINPAGVTIGSGAKINVPAGLAIGAADFIQFADGARFYALPSNGPQPAVFSTASPTAFGFLPTPAGGAVSLTGTDIATTGPITLGAGPGGISLTNSSMTTTNNTPGGGSASGPDITLASTGGAVTLQSSTLATNNVAEPEGSGSFAGAGNMTLSGQTIAIHGGGLHSQSLNGGDAGSISLSATGTAANAIQIDGGAGLSSDASEANTAIVNGNIVSIGNAGAISLQAATGGIAITGSSLTTQAGDQNPSGAGAHAGQAGAITVNAAQIDVSNAFISTAAGPPNTSGTQQNAEGVTTTTALAPASISLQATGPITVTASNIHAHTNGAVAAGDIDIAGGSVAVVGGSLNTNDSLWDGGSPSDPVQSTGKAGNINVTSTGAISFQQATLTARTQTTGSGGDVVITGHGTQGATEGILFSGGSIETGSSPAPGIVQGNAGNVTLSGPSVLLSGASVDTSTIGAGVAGNVSLTATGTSGPGASQGGTGDALLLTGATTIAATSPSYNLITGAPPGAISLAASAGSLRIDTGSSVASTAVNSQGGPITVVGATGITLDDARIESDSIHGGNIGPPQSVTLQSSGPITLSDGASISSATSGANGNNIVIETSGPVSLSGNSSLTSETTRASPAGNISVTGGSVHVSGGLITASTSFSARAGNVTLDATGADTAGGPALQVDGGAVISSDVLVNAFNGPSAGSVLLRADRGTVSVVGTPGSEGNNTTISSSTVNGGGGPAGTATLTGDNISLEGATIETTAAGTYESAFSPTITLSASGHINLVDSLLDTRTVSPTTFVPAGDIVINGTSVSVTGGQVTASTNGLSAAGSISITATGTGGGNGAAALQVSGGASVTSDASSGSSPFAKAGSVRLSAPAGTVEVGLPTDSAPSLLSSAAGVNADTAGDVTVTGATVDLQKASISTTTASDIASTTRGTITLDAGNGSGPLTIANSTLNAATSGVQQAGEIDLLGSPIVITNSTISSATTGAGSAGAICVGDPGCVATGTTVPAAGGSIQVTGSTLSTSTNTAGNAGDIQVNGSTVSVSGGNLTASTTGTGNAGNVSLTATGAGVNGAPALQVSGGASIKSDASGGASPDANAGYVRLAAPAGTVQVGLAADKGRTLLSSQAGPSAGAPGVVTITGAAVDLGNANVSTTAAGALPSATRGTIELNAGNGSGPLTIANSTLNAATSGVQQAGEIDLEGSPIAISNSTISSATTGTGSAGAICVSSGGPACGGTSGTAQTGRVREAAVAAAVAGGGSISISGSSLSTSTSTSGNAGDITVITPGALTLSGTTVASQSTSTAANAGSVGIINLSGGSVSITNGSGVLASSQGGQPGAVGVTGPSTAAAITISSTGGTTPLLISNSKISTIAQVVNGSNMVINAGGSPVLVEGSELSASATAGNGGNITINDAGDTVLGQSAIVAQAGPGNGGAINIGLTPGSVFVQDSSSIVSATSKTGNNGTVTINSPQTDLNSALRVPEVSAARTPELSANACARDASHSTFVREQRGGVVSGPEGYLSGQPAASVPQGQAAQGESPAVLWADPWLLAAITLAPDCH
jgi:filamentous hemagglutinin family protein